MFIIQIKTNKFNQSISLWIYLSISDVEYS